MDLHRTFHSMCISMCSWEQTHSPPHFGMTVAPTVGNRSHYTTYSTDTYTSCYTAPFAMYCLHSKAPYIISICVQSVYIKKKKFLCSWVLIKLTLTSSIEYFQCMELIKKTSTQRNKCESGLVLLRDSDVLVPWNHHHTVSFPSWHIINADLYRSPWECQGV